MQQLSIRSIAQEIDARIALLESDGLKPLFIVIGKTSYGYLTAELRNRTKVKEPPREYQGCKIVLDPWRHFYLEVVGDIVAHIEWMEKRKK